MHNTDIYTIKKIQTYAHTERTANIKTNHNNAYRKTHQQQQTQPKLTNDIHK